MEYGITKNAQLLELGQKARDNEIAGLARRNYQDEISAEAANAIANAQMQAYLDTTAKVTAANAPYVNVPDSVGAGYGLAQMPIVDAAEHARQMTVIGKSPYPTAINTQKYGY